MGNRDPQPDDDQWWGKPTDGVVARKLNRRFSRRVTQLILRSRFDVTPNQMSAVSFTVTLLGGLLLATQLPVIGGILVQLGSMLDGCDGEIARATGRASKKGAVLDAILDRLADGAVALGMTIFSLLYAAPILALLLPFPLVGPTKWEVIVVALGFTALVGAYSISYSTARAEATLGSSYPRLAAGRDVRLLLCFIAGVTAQIISWMMLVFLVLLAFLTFAELGWRIIKTMGLPNETTGEGGEEGMSGSGGESFRQHTG